jgi:hypothetical protein
LAPETLRAREPRRADSRSTIGSIFDADAARQQAESMFFSTGGKGKPKFSRGHGGAWLPNFQIPQHLK